jgi:hypothetical protein
MVIDEPVDARGDEIAGGPGQLFVGQQDRARLENVIAACELGNGITQPAHRTVGSDGEIGIARCVQTRCPRFEFQRQRLLRGSQDGLCVRPVRRGIRHEPESGQLSYVVAFNKDITVHTDFSFEHRVLSQAPHEHRCPAVNKAFRQPFMQRIGQTVFNFARLFLPVCRIGKPFRSVGNISPGPDL